MLSRVRSWLADDATRRTWVLGLLCVFLVCMRFPAELLHAELWGEDGWHFYPEAYYSGIHSLLWPLGGYLNSVQRVGALIAVWTHVPLLWLPTVFALMGLSVQAAVAVFLISQRLEPIWKSWRARAAFAVLYIFLPNTVETYGTLTNSQWHWGLLAFLIVIAPPGAHFAWRMFDFVALLLASFSGPFCLLYVPFCFVTLWKYRSQASARGELLTRTLLVSAGVIVQGTYLAHGHTVRHLTLGATPMLFARIIALRLVMGLLFGMHALVRIWHMAWWQAAWPALTIAVIAAWVMVVGFVRGGYLFRIFCVYAAMLFTVELISPYASPGTDQWQVLVTPYAGQRYFLVPMLALLGALFVLACQRSRLYRFTARTAIVVIVCVGVPLDSFQLHMQPTDYNTKARAFDAAPPGTRMTFPEHPYGIQDMVLVKK